MKFSTLISGIFFATAALAAPGHAPATFPAPGGRSSTFKPGFIRNGSDSSLLKRGSTLYSTNWGGWMRNDASPGSAFNYISASFIVPFVGRQSNSDYSKLTGALIWAGIDGWDSPDVLQAGLQVIIPANSDTAYYYGFYEWFPGYIQTFPSLSFKHQDKITVTISWSNSVSGTLTVTNESTGESATQHVSPPNSSTHVRGNSVELIVEQYTGGDGQPVPLLNFGDVEWMVHKVGLTNGQTYGVGGGNTIILSPNGQALTLTNFPNNGEVDTVYYGPE